MTDGAALADAFEIGVAYERRLDDHARRRGAHYTPPDVAATLVRLALSEWRGRGAPVVCDPSCGGGAVLVAAAEELRRRGATRRTVVEELVVGVDLDPGAVGAATAALRRWAGDDGVTPRVVVGDGLDERGPAAGPFDVVVGNPPFRNQLGAVTARSGAERSRMAERFGDAGSGYVDDAALFLLRGVGAVGPGGVVALLQPRSSLVARGAAGVRGRVVADLRGVWVPGQPLFDAKVDVCAPVVAVDRAASGGVWVRSGRAATDEHPAVDRAELEDGGTWSAVWATANGVPRVSSPGAGRLGDVATATAGFRDQYYGLLPHLSDRAPGRGARLVTTAMVDPAACSWADREVTVARRRRRAPWVDLDAVDEASPDLGRWIGRLARPKVLVATQTKVIEAVADPLGDVVPMTPLISVLPTGDTAVAAIETALLAPAATAWALRRFGGAGMSRTALKLAAGQVLEVPLPADRGAWDEATALVGRRAPWADVGATMNRAWAITGDAADELLEWWRRRLP